MLNEPKMYLIKKGYTGCAILFGFIHFRVVVFPLAVRSRMQQEHQVEKKAEASAILSFICRIYVRAQVSQRWIASKKAR